MEKALPYTGWALLIALLFVWAMQKFLGNWIESTANAVKEWSIGRYAARRWFRKIALCKYATALIDDYDKVPVPFMEHEDERPSIRNIYVPLQTLDGDEQRLDNDAYEAVRRSRRSIVIGPPGSGKSMLLKNALVVWAENFARPLKQSRIKRKYASRQSRDGRVPVLVELRQCMPASGIAGIKSMIIDQFNDHAFRHADRFVDRALDDGEITIFFDGLDEVATANRKSVCDLLTALAKKYRKCKMVVTCRSAIYQGQLAEKFAEIVRVADFDDAQINRFLRSWHGAPDKSSDQLLSTLSDNPRLMQLARNPLLLTLMAYLYAYRKKERGLPHSRAQFYKEATDLLLHNKPELDYSQATKMAVLQKLALSAQDTPNRDRDRQVLPYENVITAIRAVLSATNLGQADIQPLLDEIVSRSGIIMQIRGEQSFHFAHLTLQEFLSAAALADSPDELLRRYHNDPSVWREVIKLWCGYVSRNSGPVISKVFESDPILAFECLGDAVQVDDNTVRKITEHFEKELGYSEGEDGGVIDAFGAVASDPGPRGQAVLAFLIGAAKDPQRHRRVAAVRALATSKLPRAAEVLTGLRHDSQTTRAALRSMGDLAVPAFAQRARTGDLSAVDDLAAIGTPTAIYELIRLLDDTGDTAGSAAWHIASLIRNPFLEDILRNSVDLHIKSDDRLDLTWKPFCALSEENFQQIMGRVVYLIRNTKVSDGKNLPRIDVRITLPLCSMEILNKLSDNHGYVLSPSLVADIEKAERDTFPLAGRLIEVTTTQTWPARLSRLMRNVTPDKFRGLAKRLLEEQSIDATSLWLFHELDPEFQIEIIQRSFDGTRRIALEDWVAAFTPIPKRAHTVRGLLLFLIWSFGLGITGLGIAGLAIVSYPHSMYSPEWIKDLTSLSMSTVILGSFFLLIAATVVELDWLTNVLTVIDITAIVISFLASVFYSIDIFHIYIGWPGAIALLFATLLTLGLLWGLKAHYTRAAVNPFRGLVEIYKRTPRDYKTIIA
jgi:hypothetical protein